jgi:hypothetical protein
MQSNYSQLHGRLELTCLFAVFKRNNVLYSYATDFNGDREFRAVLKLQ